MIIQNPESDPLSDVLALAGLRAACSVRLQAGGAWALRFKPIELKFNVVRRGECWLRLDSAPPRRLLTGDCFVVSRTPFVLASGPVLEALDASEVFSASGEAARFGVGDEVELLGGSVSLVSPGAVELLDLLPPALIIHAESGAATSFGWLLDELDREWQSGAPVLRAIHGTPERSWTLTELSSLACLSRSSFAALFKTVVGQAPVEYATRWRMQVAAARLLDGVDSVATVAAALGYLSDAAFGVAFRRVHGKSPGRYRRETVGISPASR